MSNMCGKSPPTLVCLALGLTGSTVVIAHCVGVNCSASTISAIGIERNLQQAGHCGHSSSPLAAGSGSGVSSTHAAVAVASAGLAATIYECPASSTPRSAAAAIAAPTLATSFAAASSSVTSCAFADVNNPRTCVPAAVSASAAASMAVI